MINITKPGILNQPKSSLNHIYSVGNRNAIAVESFLVSFYIIHILAGIILFYTNIDLFHAYVTEDSYLEYLTAFLLLALSFFCMYKGLFFKSGIPAISFCAIAIIFFLGFGEEISWGQRIFGFATPDDLKNINAQKEFNLHNIMVSGVKLNKLLFGKLLYTGIFFFFLGFPLLYRSKVWFRRLVNKFAIPVPSTLYSTLYFISFFIILFVQHGEKWELQEFTVAGYLFITFLFPANNLIKLKFNI